MTEVAPFGSPFNTSNICSNLHWNVFGSIPILVLGAYLGVKRIVAVTEYCGKLSCTSPVIHRVITEELDDNTYKAQNMNHYLCGHYLRGGLEILGLGSILTIMESLQCSANPSCCSDPSHFVFFY